jgi:hypothetical protein
MDIKKVSGIVLLVLLFFAGGTGGYLYFAKVFSKDTSVPEGSESPSGKIEDLFSVRIYYPAGQQLQIEERRLPRKTGQMAIAETVIEQYLKVAGTAQSGIPRDTKLLNLYRGADRILYVDLSDDFRRNFQGDVLTEFLLLKGLYESIISNVEDIQDVKILIEGKEIETLGGHLYLLYPLKDIVSYGFS